MNEYVSGTAGGESPIVAERTYKLIALRGVVAFPNQTFHIDIMRDKALNALNKAIDNQDDTKYIMLVAQKHASMVNPSPKDLYKVGTICRIKQIVRLTNENVRIIVHGVERAKVIRFLDIGPYFEVSVSALDTVVENEGVLEAASRQLKSYLDEYRKLDSNEALKNLDFNDIANVINTIGNVLIKSDAAKQRLLEQQVLEKQAEAACVFLASEAEILRTEKQVSARVRKQMDKNQREYFLKEQQKAIMEELGEADDEIEILKERIKKLKLPDEAQTKLEREIKRLAKMSAMTPEAAVIRNYVDWVLDIPWHEETKDNTNLDNAQQVLDEDHFGLEKVKERIIEFLAVHQLTKSLKGPILCFVGPPGVGKTSIVKSIARALGRKFVSMSLGGVRDEAEIRGHRRTYIGAIPGRIISQMKLAGTINPVFLFDEIDKMSSDFRGDPASAMLEVLDPEQNFQFRDNFLDVPYDLSKVMFITTANTMESIPIPLLDRMEVIELSGYTQEEKVEIAKRFLIPKNLRQHGINEGALSIDNSCIERIISSYTRESGVRSLEREIANIARKMATKIVALKNESATFDISSANLEDYLGVAKYVNADLSTENLLGAATGLAWTSVGGKIMTIEVAITEGKGEITITGNLGDVMKESCRTALTLVKKRAEEYRIDSQVFSSSDIHIHVPEGATPKDGPSAGITIATAILSALSSKKVKRDVAMTGEITLRGKVLAIGGLKEKALAAYRAGAKEIVIPKDNAKDWQEIPASARECFDVHFVDNIDDVFKVALVND